MNENRYDGATRDELLEAYDQLYAVENAAKAERLRVVAAMERRGVHTQDGQRTMRSWLQLHSSVTARTAGRWADVAGKLDDLPNLARSFAEGRISFDKLVTCASFATPEDDAEVAREALEGNILKCEAAAHRKQVVSEGREERARATKSLNFSWTDRGTRMVVRGYLPADEGATVRAAIERVADSLPLRDEEGALRETQVRRAEALVMVSRATIADDHDPDRATVVVNVDLDTLVENAGRGDEVTGGAFSSTVMQHLVCDARIQSVVRNGAGDHRRGTHDAHRTPMVATTDARARRRVPLPGVRKQAVRSRASHPLVDPRGRYGPREPGGAMSGSPPARSQEKLDGKGRPEPRHRIRRPGR